MNTVNTKLDKTVDVALSEEYGSMSIRVVVLAKPEIATASEGADDTPLDLAEDEAFVPESKSPVRGYLEDPRKGKECCVFLINGQRQDAWDNLFIMRELD